MTNADADHVWEHLCSLDDTGPFHMAAEKFNWGEALMVRRWILGALCGLVCSLAMVDNADAQAPQAFGQSWGGAASNRDYSRFNHYPYVYYPQNYWGSDYFKSSDSLYYRYPPEMQIPVYNRKWRNEYPSPRRYHWGHHFITDVF